MIRKRSCVVRREAVGKVLNTVTRWLPTLYQVRFRSRVGRGDFFHLDNTLAGFGLLNMAILLKILKKSINELILKPGNNRKIYDSFYPK